MDRCAGCRGRPRGAAGFGGDVATRPDSRDAPHRFGLGLQEMLANEMTRDLRTQRDQALRSAVSGTSPRCRRNPAACASGPRPVTQRLVSKGVSLRHDLGPAFHEREYDGSLRTEFRKVYEFLDTLILFPPDDTASNLNPGDRSANPQQPAGHGSIHLGARFQIVEEGAE